MGHRANYVIVENGHAVAYQDPYGALGCTFVLADGPGECKNLAQSAEPTGALMSWAEAEAGFLLDFDKRRCIAFGTPQLDQTEELPPEVLAQVTTIMNALEQGPAVMFESIARHWPGWTMVWDARGVDAFGEYLDERGITSVAAPPPGGSEGVIGMPIEVVIPSAVVQAALSLAEGSGPRQLPLAGAAVPEPPAASEPAVVSAPASTPAPTKKVAPRRAATPAPAKKVAPKRAATPARKPVAKKTSATKTVAKKTAAKKASPKPANKAATKKRAAKPATKTKAKSAPRTRTKPAGRAKTPKRAAKKRR